MVELTKEQGEAFAKEETPTVIDPQTRTAYVLVRLDVFEHLQVLLADDTVYATAELVDRVMALDDAQDPYLEEYQRLYGDKP